MVETDALLNQLDHSKLSPGALDAVRAELSQLLLYVAQLRSLPLDGFEPALGAAAVDVTRPQRRT